MQRQKDIHDKLVHFKGDTNPIQTEFYTHDNFIINLLNSTKIRLINLIWNDPLVQDSLL